jgi:hypothetical protein
VVFLSSVGFFDFAFELEARSARGFAGDAASAGGFAGDAASAVLVLVELSAVANVTEQIDYIIFCVYTSHRKTQAQIPTSNMNIYIFTDLSSFPSWPPTSF